MMHASLDSSPVMVQNLSAHSPSVSKKYDDIHLYDQKSILNICKVIQMIIMCKVGWFMKFSLGRQCKGGFGQKEGKMYAGCQQKCN
jgi:hypothetical protein